MGGQTAYVKLRGRTMEDMLIHKTGIAGGMKMANGENPKGYGTKGQAPVTRMAVAALQRNILVRAQTTGANWTISAPAKRKSSPSAIWIWNPSWRCWTANVRCTSIPIAPMTS